MPDKMIELKNEKLRVNACGYCRCLGDDMWCKMEGKFIDDFDSIAPFCPLRDWED